MTSVACLSHAATRRLAVALLVSLLVVGSVHAQSGAMSGVKIGMCSKGDVHVEGETIRQDNCLTLGFFGDLPAGEHFSYGMAIDLLWMDWSGGTTSFALPQSEALLDASIQVKANLPCFDDRLTFRPGVGIGYGAMRRRAMLNGTNYLTLKAFVEVVYALPRDRGLLAEIGVWDAPSGGDDDTTVHIGPLLLMRVGFVF